MNDEFLTNPQIDQAKDHDLDELMGILENALTQIQEKNPHFDKERFDLYQGAILKQLFINYLDETHSILVAPTGSGKSLISLLYTYCVSVLNDNGSDGEEGEENTKSCTILATDTFLQNQYIESNDFFTKHIIGSKFSMLKGKGQYTCMQTNTPYPQGICGKKKVTPIKAIEKGWECANSCTYVRSYMDALNANIRVFNYHLFLSYANYVGEHKLLAGNPTIVLDECHKVDDILDGFANTVIGVAFVKSIHTMRNTLELMKPELLEKFNSIATEVLKAFGDLYKIVMQGGTSKDILDTYTVLLDKIEKLDDESDKIVYLDEMGNLSVDASKTIHGFVTEIIKAYQKQAEGNDLPATIQAVFDFSDFVEKAYFLRRDVKGVSPEHFVINYDPKTKNITIANICTSERFQNLIRDHINCPMVFMSATVGNADYFGKYLGLNENEFRIIDVESMFDFSKSPIVAIKPMLSLSKNNIEATLPKMIARIDNILDVHKDQNGVIHTANKEVANYIVSNTRHKNRVITYGNSQEKRNVIERLNAGTNFVIVAYSMEEGVDFKDDLGRFQIIAKLSWSYLGDYIVKRKMELYDQWYEMTTLNKLLQTFGRTNRHINDYSITYILDSSFARLVDQMDSITKNRITYKFYDEITREFMLSTFQIEEKKNLME